MKKTPLQQVKERFGSKEALVKELQALFDKGDLFVERLNPDKGLIRVANAKLLKLYDTAQVVKDKFGNRDALITAILEAMNRTKDADFRAKLEKWGLPRLWDYYKSAARRAKKAADKNAAS